MPRKKKAVAAPTDVDTPIPVDVVEEIELPATRTRKQLADASANDANKTKDKSQKTPQTSVLTAAHVNNLLKANKKDINDKFKAFENSLMEKISALIPSTSSEKQKDTENSDKQNTRNNDNDSMQNRSGSSSSSSGDAAVGGGRGENSLLQTNVGDQGDASSRYAPSAAAVHEGDKGMTIDTDTIAKSLHQLLGKPDSIAAPFSNSNLLVAGSFLSLKIKNAIRAGEYVELGLMDQKVETTSKVGIAVSPTSFSLTPTRARKARDETEWVKWFSTYASVYVASYPAAAPEMFSYLIKMLHWFAKYSFLEGRNYDEHFRWAKSQCPSLSWHKTDHDILELVTEGRAGATTSIAARKNPLTAKKPGQFTQKGNTSTSFRKPNSGLHCFDFNNADSYCTRAKCPYDHTCSNCKGYHPKFKCHQTSTATATTPAVTPAATAVAPQQPRQVVNQRKGRG